MNDAIPIQRAQELMQLKRYDEARSILINLDHPMASDMLAQIEEIMSTRDNVEKSLHDEKPSASSTSRLAQLQVAILGLIALLMIAILGVSVADLLQPTPSDTEKWEYMLFSYNQYLSDYGVIIHETVDFTQLEYQQLFANNCGFDLDCLAENSVGLNYYLDVIGNDGWEMVTSNNNSGSNTYRIELLFKRRL